VYSIGYVIYGFPLTEEIDKELSRLEGKSDSGWHDSNDRECGFTTTYDGSSPKRQGWVGVVLTSFDAMGELPMSDVSKCPSHAQKVIVQRRIDALLPSLKKLVDIPGVYVVFGTS
tara:strand:- start:597 stop:941 length:345 start_codon:yes stop_codon:yes gene_type:complete